METSIINQIQHIKIEKVWGIYDFSWDLISSVNVLIGENGSGKSTVVNLLYALLSFDINLLEKYDYKKISIRTNIGELWYQKGNKYFEIDDSTIYKGDFETNLAFISTFDKIIIKKQAKDKTIKYSYNKATSLDNELAILIDIFIRYQLDIYMPNHTNLHHSTENLTEKVKEVMGKNLNKFFSMLNDVIFKNKYKASIDKTYSILLTHYQTKQEIKLPKLSSGEKQILIILLQALVTKNQPCIFLLDEPEVSLHLSIQEQLIDTIRTLNENAQLIIVTHSPSIVRKGYMDSYFDIENLKTYEKQLG
jgi:predicted ATPase